MRDTGIADRLRAFGLTVVEVNGWRTRGSSTFNPRGSVDHHTADGPGNAPSLRICIEGRSDLPGPLCNVLIGRDNTCYVIAAGRANHAGKGGYKGLSGNSSAYGVERENRGTTADPWRADQTEVAARCHAALIEERTTAKYVCGHKEWTSRKVDAHSINYDNFREMVRAAAQPLPPQEPEDEEMKPFLLTNTETGHSYVVLSDAMVWISDPTSYASHVARFDQPLPVGNDQYKLYVRAVNNDVDPTEPAA